MDVLELAAYRREVAEAYAAARAAGAEVEGWRAWRTRRDRLIGTSAESPLPADRRSPSWRTPFFEHDPTWRLAGVLEPVADPVGFDIPHSGSGATRFVEAGVLRAVRGGVAIELTAFWLDAYGGGIFVPFRDGTCGAETYGGGRYLLDTVKGADLGVDAEGRVVMDFNYAYHPSCAWDPSWSCPLAPPSNVVGVRVEAGEQLPVG